MSNPRQEAPRAAPSSAELQRQLDETRRELEQFTYSVSHDMKGPLHTIKGFIEIILDDVQAGRQQTLHEDLLRIQDAANTLQAQLDCILHLSRLGRRTLVREDLPVAALWEETLRRWGPSFARVGGSLSFEGNVSVLRFDPTCFHELLDYLLENSLAFRCSDRPLRVRVSLEDRGACIQGRVLDNGRGIQPQQLETIFQLFRKVEPQAKGMGAGLTYAHRILTLHGGRIWAEDAGGEGGLCVVFELPKQGSSGET